MHWQQDTAGVVDTAPIAAAILGECALILHKRCDQKCQPAAVFFLAACTGLTDISSNAAQNGILAAPDVLKTLNTTNIPSSYVLLTLVMPTPMAMLYAGHLLANR